MCMPPDNKKGALLLAPLKAISTGQLLDNVLSSPPTVVIVTQVASLPSLNPVLCAICGF